MSSSSGGALGKNFRKKKEENDRVQWGIWLMCAPLAGHNRLEDDVCDGASARKAR